MKKPATPQNRPGPKSLYVQIKGLTQDVKKKENDCENVTKSVKRKISPTISTTQSISKVLKQKINNTYFFPPIQKYF